MRQIHSKWLPWAAALLMLWMPGVAAARTCDIDAVPAATLLIPYFEVDPAALVAPFPALPAPGGKPHWAPLPLPSILSCDEEENCTSITGSAPLATQRVLIGAGGGIPATVPFGWLEIKLNHRKVIPGKPSSLFSGFAQGWIISAYGAAVGGSPAGAALRAFRLPSQEAYCKP